MEQGQFHITIGSSPVAELTLENDMRMVKAALLYADKVKLCSFMSSMMLLMMAFKELKPKQQIEFLESVVPMLVSDKSEVDNLLTGLRTYKQFGRSKNLTKQELLLRAKLQPKIRQMWTDLGNVVTQMLEKAGADSLVYAIRSNLLELHVLGASGKTESDAMVKEFVEVLSQTISNSTTYPLFDDQTGNIVRLGVKEGKLNVSAAGIARGKHSALAANLFERLPLFDEAPIDELLDIRTELGRPLIRFRAAVIKFSEEIKNAAWDEDFSIEAETVFHRDVEPAILDIEDAVNANSYLATLARKFVDKPLAIASGSALALLMSQLSALPHIVSEVVPIALTSGTVAYDAYKEWQEKSGATEKNCLFFYYKAKVMLSEEH
jgi:hypothetical protein